MRRNGADDAPWWTGVREGRGIESFDPHARLRGRRLGDVRALRPGWGAPGVAGAPSRREPGLAGEPESAQEAAHAVVQWPGVATSSQPGRQHTRTPLCFAGWALH